MDICGSCDHNGCEPYWVWNPIEQQRTLMCTKRVDSFSHIYGESSPLPLVLDPSCISYTNARLAASACLFFGSYCDGCEEPVQGKLSPGLRVGTAVLCRGCAKEADEAILVGGVTLQIGGMDVEPRAWCVLKLETHLSVRETRCEFNFAYKRNMAIVQSLWERFHELRLEDDND